MRKTQNPLTEYGYMCIMPTGSLKIISRKLKALSDPTRLKLLTMLATKPLCVCELTHAIELAQPTVSRHLQQLEETGFVDKSRNGAWIIYALAPQDKLDTLLLDNILAHTTADIECADLIKKLENVNRHTLTGAGKRKKISGLKK